MNWNERIEPKKARAVSSGDKIIEETVIPLILKETVNNEAWLFVYSITPETYEQ